MELSIFHPEGDTRRREEEEVTGRFRLEGKRLVLARPLDRDESDLSSIMLQVTCTTLSSGRRRTIPVVLTIADLNDNGPVFVGEPYVVTIPEVGSAQHVCCVVPSR